MVGIRLVITLTQDGQINVEGPLHDIVLCYGLLERAKDVARSVAEAQQKRIVQPAVGVIPQLGQNGR